MSKLETTLICLLVLVIAAAGFAFYFEHRGEVKIEKTDAMVVAKAETHNTQVETTQKAEDKTAGDKLNAALTDPIGALPSIPSVQPTAQASCPSPVPHPRSAPSQSLPTVPVRTEPPAAVVQPDWHTIERSDVQSAHDADAEVTYWKGLLIAQYKTCGGSTP